MGTPVRGISTVSSLPVALILSSMFGCVFVFAVTPAGRMIVAGKFALAVGGVSLVQLV